MDTSSLFDRYCCSSPAFADATRAFHHDVCRQHLPEHGGNLETGPGPKNATSAFLSSLGTLAGVDISAEGEATPALAESRTCDGKMLPFSAASFDACASNHVLEHVELPKLHLREAARALMPGGVYCFRTPNSTR